MHMINKRLLVGNADDARNPPPQVNAVLMVAEEQNVTVPSRVIYAKIPLKEFGEPAASALYEAVEWIAAHMADNRLMVCCRVGMGRSVSVVIAYLGNGLCRCGEACVDQASRRHAVAAPPRNDSGCLSPPANPSEFINVLEAALSGTFRFVLLRQFLIPLRTLSL